MNNFEAHTSSNNSIYHQDDINLNFAMHFHANFEFVYCYDGNIIVNCDDKQLELNAGQATLILPCQNHNYITRNYSKSYICIFSSDFISAFAGKINNAQKDVELVAPIFDQISSEDIAQFRSTKDLYLAKSFLYKVCSFANASGLQKQGGRHNKQLIPKIVEYVGSNCKNDISIKQLSKDLGYSAKYLGHFFMQNFKCNFSEYVNTTRLQMSLKLLRETDLSITQISIECGFGSIRTFNRVFDHRYNCSPKSYRKDLSIDLVNTKTK